MSLVKTKLKATRDAISKKDFISARDSALTILDYESDNYNACANINCQTVTVFESHS